MGEKKIRISEARATLYPVPVTLISCSFEGIDNIITIAWTGVLCSKPPIIYIAVRPARYSYGLIKNSGKFVLNIPPLELLKIVDLCGHTSGKSTDKFAKYGLTKMTLVEGYPPCISECKHHLLCDVIEIKKLGTHDVFISKVAYEFINDDCQANGKVKYQKVQPIAYCCSEYLQLSEKVGHYGEFR